MFINLATKGISSRASKVIPPHKKKKTIVGFVELSQLDACTCGASVIY